MVKENEFTKSVEKLLLKIEESSSVINNDRSEYFTWKDGGNKTKHQSKVEVCEFILKEAKNIKSFASEIMQLTENQIKKETDIQIKKVKK